LALRQLSSALKRVEVAGAVTNLAFLGALADDPDFRQGAVDTGLITREIDRLVHLPVPGSEDSALAVLAGLDLLAGNGPQAGFSLWEPMRRQVTVIHDATEITASVVTKTADAHDVTIGQATHKARRLGAGWRMDGRPIPAFRCHGKRVTVFAQYGMTFTLVDPLERAMIAGPAAGIVEAPMPGLVRQVAATPGQIVAKGDKLAVLEAMKMEYTLTAARDGVVAEVLVAAGAQVSAGAALVRLEEELEGRPE
jgi:3-methylcrotonyl-CoA carboxylase alpha subunit